MDTRFRQEPDRLKMTIPRMAALTERALESSITSLPGRDVETAGPPESR